MLILNISYKWNHTVCDLSFLASFLSLNIVFWGSSMIEHISGQKFIFMAGWYSIVWILFIYHILFIHSSVDGCLDSFHFLALMNNAAMNICVQVFWQVLFLLDVYGHMVTIFKLLRDCQTVFQGDWILSQSHQQCDVIWAFALIFISKIGPQFYCAIFIIF